MPTTVKSPESLPADSDGEMSITAIMMRALALALTEASVLLVQACWGRSRHRGADGTVAGEGFYVYEELKHAETVALEQAEKNRLAQPRMFLWNLMRIMAALRRVPTA